jgi:hypothetical protein
MQRRLTKCAVLLAALAVSAGTASAQPEQLRYELVDVRFADGGRAEGYVVVRQAQTVELGCCAVADWLVTVSGGNESMFAPLTYDPTTSTADYSAGFTIPGLPPILPSLSLTEIDGNPQNTLRRVLRFLPGDAQSEIRPVDGGYRAIVAGELTPVVTPIIVQTVNDLRPASRVVHTDGLVDLKLRMYRGGWTTEVDWYWAIKVDDGDVLWVSAAGLTATPRRLARCVPYKTVDPLTGIQVPIDLINASFAPGTVLTSVFIAVDRSTVVAYDVMTAVVGQQ